MFSFFKLIVILSHVLTLCYALPAGNGGLPKGRNPPRHIATLPDQLTYHVDTRNGHEAKANSKWRSPKNRNTHLEEASFHDKKVQEIGNKLHANPKPLNPEEQAKADQRHENIRKDLTLERAARSGHVIL